MTDNIFFNLVLIAVFVFAAFTIVTLFVVDAPYGRHQRAGWGPQIPTRLGWVLMESPASLFFLYFYFNGMNAFSVVPLILLLMWQAHYMHRSFIYPFLIKVKAGATTPLAIILPGALFCGVNGYLNGSYVSHYADHLTAGWLLDIRFWIGFLLFCYGYYLNKSSDSILRNLRGNSDTGYKIPYGGGFELVSMPNYLGEILTWVGFAIASWSLPGLAFVVFTLANLVPRAVTNHKWYLEKFPDYPKNRKAIIPYLL